jgi:hypothetical protein
MLEDIEKYMGMLWALGLKINKPRIIGKHRKDIGGCWKGPQCPSYLNYF